MVTKFNGGGIMTNSITGTILCYLVLLVLICGMVYAFLLIKKSIKKYIASGEIREEKSIMKKTLGETIKEYRINCKMTQEFVAENLGVSRQAVSKWENGTSDPSTSNLLALAKLYGVSPKEILDRII